MHSLLIPGLVAFLLSLPLTYLTIRLAHKYGYTDIPSRKHPAILHSKPIARAGGIPIFLSFAITSLIFSEINLLLIGIILGGLLTVIVGTLDDKKDIAPGVRLFTQFLSASVIIFSGISFYTSHPTSDSILYFDYLSIHLPFINSFIDSEIVFPADLILIFWIMLLMNTANWTKGVSQLPGIAVIALLTVAGVAYQYQTGNSLQEQTMLLAVIGAGAILAFLPFNFPPEKIFPGFGGSTFIGFLLAVLAVLSGSKVAAVLIVFAVPLIDAVLVGLKRILTGQNPLKHDREHLYHFLLDGGFTKRQIIYLYWSSALVFGLTALLLETRGKIIAIASLTVIISAFFTYLYFQKKRKATE